MIPSESIPDLLTSVKLLAAPAVDIAAASVAERSLVDVVRQMEEEGKNSDSTVTVDEAEIQEETQVPVEAPVADDPAVAETVEETKVSEDVVEEAEAPAGEEETPAEDDQTMVPPSEEPVGEAEPEAVLVETQSAEEPVIIDEAPPAAAATEEEAAAAAEEPTAEAAQTVLPEEESAEAEVFSAVEPEPETAVEQDESCHCAPPADDPAPPAAVEGVLACDETMDIMLESEEQEAASE